MLAGMRPELDDKSFVFVVIEDGASAPGNAFALVHEAEGTTAIVPTQDAEPLFARITLAVHSDLEGVGLTAAVSSALAAKGIACNVIAGFHHDHLFVPWERGVEALGILEALSHDARR
ncbi:ACT domain-containing protein [Erythrobacter sp.]|uniref:ACT domain-containing protein n=1 Tax=Erythrobacter sp. TaxID=1042 RepID=UPI001425F8CC|nr:ACT domain-containing protein [Erythrobacter sp.]QIQ88213.1 MAG: ACT domain-containing protein [Erythrobacter sp.]